MTGTLIAKNDFVSNIDRISKPSAIPSSNFTILYPPNMLCIFVALISSNSLPKKTQKRRNTDTLTYHFTLTKWNQSITILYSRTIFLGWSSGMNHLNCRLYWQLNVENAVYLRAKKFNFTFVTIYCIRLAFIMLSRMNWADR